MNDKIAHSGVIERIEGDHVQVRIVQTSACAACKVAGYCSAAESKEKLVDVLHADIRHLKVGDPVVVTAPSRIATQALLWAFGVPFIVMVSVLVTVLSLTHHEGLAALSGLLALLPYYGVLYLLRGRMARQFTFSIQPTN